MKLAFEILTISTIAFTLVHVIRYAEPIKRFFKLKRLKPFDCETCTAFHIAWVYFCQQYPLLNSLAIATIPLVLTVYLTKYAR